MTDLEKLRLLIWDKDEKVFKDEELEEFLDDAGGNVYAAAALVLRIVQADPDRKQSYSRGGVSVQLQDINQAISRYEDMAVGGSGFYTTSTERVYPDAATKR